MTANQLHLNLTKEKHLFAVKFRLLLSMGLAFCFYGHAQEVTSGNQSANNAGVGQAAFDSCYARWSDGELVIGNKHIERKWRIENGLLYATSFQDKATNAEWVLRPASQPAPLPPTALPQGSAGVRFKTGQGAQGATQVPSLVIEMTNGSAKNETTYRFQVFPAARGVLMQVVAPAQASSGAMQHRQNAQPEGATATGVEQNRTPARTNQTQADTLEDIELTPRHLRLTQVALADQTDTHNELVHEREWLLQANEQTLRLQGNLFFIEDSLTNAGLIFLKQAPLPHARPLKAETDFTIDVQGMSLPFPKVDAATGQLVPSTAQPSGYRARFLNHGISDRGGAGYSFVTLAYTGGRAGRVEALQTYQRQLRRYEPSRDGMFLSNTWGDRSRDARINQDFISKEVEAGKRLGVDVVQIDDGWQAGRTQNSAQAGGVWNGFWASNPNFWEVNTTRFPEGLQPIVSKAKSGGIEFGLWFAPDSTNDSVNWERDANKILELHRTLGINYFKLDAVKATTRESEQNFRRFYDKVLRESNGKVVFDLDVTAEIRPGYFGAIEAGPVFVENRYTDTRRYFPHQTLRNLWSLAQYVDPLRLRVEFLNNARNVQAYEGDPLAPARYGSSYLFATTMMANPLGWFEVSNLPEAYVSEVADLAKVWKTHRREMFGNLIVPVGSKPDGTSWTGFASVSENRRSGYVLVFRELNKQREVTLDVPMLTTADYRVTPLAGSGTAMLSNGQLTVRIPEALSFVFIRVSAK